MFEEFTAAVAGARTPAGRVGAQARLENAACAARLASMYQMLERAYAASGSADREQWRCDTWSAVCAQIGAAQTITGGMANGQLMTAVILAEKLPMVGAVFDEGLITYLVVRTICTRTGLVKDPDAVRAVDAELAADLRSHGARSLNQLDADIDAVVLRHDPYAVRRVQDVVRSTGVTVDTDGATGVSRIEATVEATDGAAFQRRVELLARTVCDRDPRTADQRRAAAVGAMGFGWDRLPCMCETDGCAAASRPAVGGVVIHVITRRDTLDGATDDEPDTGDEPPTAPEHPEERFDVDPQPPADGDEPRPDPEFDTGRDEIESRLGSPSGQSESEPGDGSLHARYEDRSSGEATGESTPEPELDPWSESDTPCDESDSQPDADSRRADDARAPGDEPVPTGDLAAQRRGLVGEQPRMLSKPLREYTFAELCAEQSADPGQFCPAGPGVVLGGGVLPAPLIAHLAMHARITALIHPGQAPPEPRYRPSRRLADFVRARDLTCRHPGCTRPATVCQIDHVIPWPYGATMASNLACLCVEHHLLKTFWPGWTYTLAPDGTAVWTDPDGQQTTTYPGSRLLFGELCAPTAEVVTTGTPPPKHTAGLTMPRRAITRKQARAKRIDDERRANTEWVEQYLRESIPPF